MTDETTTENRREPLSGEGWAWALGVAFGVACVFALIALIIGNYRAGDDNDTRERIVQVEACGRIEDDALRTLCVTGDRD